MRDYDPLTALAADLVKQYGADFAVRLYQWIADDQNGDHPDVFAVPAPPVTGTVVRDCYGCGWTVALDEDYTGRGNVPRVLVRNEQADAPGIDVATQALPPNLLHWADMVYRYGPLVVVRQDPEDARLYGPTGERWGDPSIPCNVIGNDPETREPMICKLGMNHAGPHVSPDGVELGPLDQSAPSRKGADADTPCTCGNPAQHALGCPRHPNYHTSRNAGHFELEHQMHALREPTQAYLLSACTTLALGRSCRLPFGHQGGHDFGPLPGPYDVLPLQTPEEAAASIAAVVQDITQTGWYADRTAEHEAEQERAQAMADEQADQAERDAIDGLDRPEPDEL